MNYCEKCNRLCESTRCDACGSQELREVKDSDFCFLLSCNEVFGEMLNQTLLSMGIECALLPFGNGVRTAFGFSLGNYNVYVPYESYQAAKDVVEMFAAPVEEMRKDLLSNSSRWHIPKNSAQKKLLKRWKKRDLEELFAFIKEAVQNAQYISDEGTITDCLKGGRYISVNVDGKYIMFNSVTYEIYV